MLFRLGNPNESGEGEHGGVPSRIVMANDSGIGGPFFQVAGETQGNALYIYFVLTK